MDSIQRFREYTRQLECHLGNMNQADCCCCGVSQTQCFLIVEIGRKPGISVKELAEILRTDKSSISRSVEELVQKGFVERTPSKEDRRYVELRLLQKGQERFEKIEHDMYIKFKEVWDRIPVEKQEQVLEALKLYNEACFAVEEGK
ncbi:MAG: MarR family transcriptional regulator [Lachnospiraceae bacterium]|nr:MarR family transcriptional regulator [Lachnospiraceae bacterium]